jgi:hypothetical protein
MSKPKFSPMSEPTPESESQPKPPKPPKSPPKPPSKSPPKSSSKAGAKGRAKAGGFTRGAAAVYAALLHALDVVLEEGVPRASLVRADLSVGQADEWQRAFVQAEALVTELHAHPLGRSVARRTRLVVIAASLGALARQAGLDDAGHPGLVQLRASLDEAFAYAKATHDERLARALGGSAA